MSQIITNRVRTSRRALLKGLTAAGAQIVAPPADMPWNARECTIQDPDGYRLTFSEPINIHRSFDEVIQEASKPENQAKIKQAIADFQAKRAQPRRS